MVGLFLYEKIAVRVLVVIVVVVEAAMATTIGEIGEDLIDIVTMDGEVADSGEMGIEKIMMTEVIMVEDMMTEGAEEITVTIDIMIVMEIEETEEEVTFMTMDNGDTMEVGTRVTMIEAIMFLTTEMMKGPINLKAAMVVDSLGLTCMALECSELEELVLVVSTISTQ